MFAFAQLRELERRLRNRKVLSLLVDTSDTDSKEGSARRDELNRALFRLDAMAPYVSRGERIAPELCMPTSGSPEVADRRKEAVSGIAATLSSPPVGSNAGVSSQTTPA